jgi:hypothetical protein
LAFKGQDTIRSETVTDNKIIEQVNFFSSSGNLTADNKFNNHLQTTGIMNNVF